MNPSAKAVFVSAARALIADDAALLRQIGWSVTRHALDALRDRLMDQGTGCNGASPAKIQSNRAAPYSGRRLPVRQLRPQLGQPPPSLQRFVLVGRTRIEIGRA